MYYIYMVLKELRTLYNIPQSQAANVCNISLRSYARYEKDDNYGSNLTRQMIIQSIKSKYEITEEKGILSLEQIKNIVTQTLQPYREKISFCILFGSYAWGVAKEKSDVDLCVSTSLEGLDVMGLIEKLRVNLHKKIDFVFADSLPQNPDLMYEILKGGIRILG